jgi:hypothetical protein
MTTKCYILENITLHYELCAEESKLPLAVSEFYPRTWEEGLREVKKTPKSGPIPNSVRSVYKSDVFALQLSSYKHVCFLITLHDVKSSYAEWIIC